MRINSERQFKLNEMPTEMVQKFESDLLKRFNVTPLKFRERIGSNMYVLGFNEDIEAGFHYMQSTINVFVIIKKSNLETVVKKTLFQFYLDWKEYSHEFNQDKFKTTYKKAL